MNPDIHLLYFEGCPNVEKARENLRAALEQTGLPVRWTEVDLQSPDAPAKWRGFPSPSVLINEVEILTGKTYASGTAACRFGGAPTIEMILSHLRTRDKKPLLASFAALPAALLSLIPIGVCGACYPALIGLLSALGLGALVTEAVLKPLMIGLLLIAVFGLVYQARRSGKYLPLLLGLVGAVGLYTSSFAVSSFLLKVASIALLLTASIFNVIPVLRRAGGKSCPACQE